ncbi:hypothetical protein [Burkholderia gladioli]|uniref:hypothetical protein n=1 Tax=Burkholderia gladioli TaxID=28095 RepID=UPI0013F63300|nr:hypothetical protein [Burkholderia gladioli]NHH80710.1 hypothetical protein [Burkholderia gladioli]
MAATPVTWNDPSTAQDQLDSQLPGDGSGITVILRINWQDPMNRGNSVQGLTYLQASYRGADAFGSLMWLSAEGGPRRLYGVTGWILPA